MINDVTALFKTTFHTFKKVEKSISMLRRNTDDIKRTQMKITMSKAKKYTGWN